MFKIDEIFPLLLDNYIEEIFMDSIDDYIYINHQVYGRCRTLIQVRLETVNALKTYKIGKPGKVESRK